MTALPLPSRRPAPSVNRLVLPLVAVGLLTARSAAVELGYSNDFSSSTNPPTGFTEFADAQWLVSGGVYQNTLSGFQASSAATVQVTNRAATQNFTLQSTFTPKVTSGSFSFGLAALGDVADTRGGVGSNFYLADINHLGFLRIGTFFNNVFTQLVGTTSGMPVPVLDQPLTLTLSGVYSGSNLVLSLSATNGTTTGSVSTAALTAAANGQYFGFRNRNNSTSVPDYSVSVDNFSVVPEPSAALFVASGLGVLGMLRRRPVRG